MTTPADTPTAILVVLDTYRDLRKRGRRYVSWNGNTVIHRYYNSDGEEVPPPPPREDGLEKIRSTLKDQSLMTPDSAALREQLMLEAARRGYIYLVQELLCPSSSSVPPVSMSVIEEGTGNSLLHLAVLSGCTKLVRWLVNHVGDMDSDIKIAWLGNLNNQLETPFSSAIRRGKMPVVFAFINSRVSHHYYCYFRCEWKDYFKRIGAEDDFHDFSQGQRPIREFRDLLTKFRDASSQESDAHFSRHVLSSLAMLDARLAAHSVLKKAIDNWARPMHLETVGFSFCLDEDKLDLENFRQHFEGMFNPWWDSEISEFDIAWYTSARSTKDQRNWFHLLDKTLGAGHFDTAMWMLSQWKAPPSLLSCEHSDYCGEWYLRNAIKLMETTVFGWTGERATTEDISTEKKSRDFSRSEVENVIREVLGSIHTSENDDYDNTRMLINRLLWQVGWGDDKRLDSNALWKKLYDEANQFGDRRWFGVPPQKFAAIKLACTAPLSDFEESQQAKLLTYFLQHIYDQDPDFVSADLPSLAKFVVLDHLPFFQYLTKTRRDNSGAETSFLDLDMPLLCPLTNLSSSHEGEDSIMVDEGGNEIDNDCSICLEPITDPFTLKCGHSFHHKCLFRFIFPELRTSTDDDTEQLTHEVLARSSHLSFTLGQTSCPYCRQAVKPSLREALALNLADGLRRTSAERRKRPHSPHIYLGECRVGITVGEALLAFAACSGAVNIFQWLVLEHGLKPEETNVGGVNIMYHAVSHRQVLIVRWLLKNGYAGMLRGDLEGDAFDTYSPADGALENFDLIDLEDETKSKRCKIWKREIMLRAHRGNREDHELPESEKELLRTPPTEAEMLVVAFQIKTENASPMHFLLMNSFGDFDCSIDNFFFKAVKSLCVSVVPANWCQLVLSLSVDSTMRSDAKAFLSQGVLTITGAQGNIQIPDDIANGVQQSTFEDVLAQPAVAAISPLEIAKNPSQYNLWNMLMKGEKDWRPFLQVATCLDIWKYWSSFEWFEDRPDTYAMLIDFLVQCGRVDIIAAFSIMDDFCDRYGYGVVGLFDIFATEQRDTFVRPRIIAVRPIVERREKTHLFAPFFERVDLVKQTKQELYRHKIIERVIGLIGEGKSTTDIEQDMDQRRDSAVALAGSEPPLGIGTRQAVVETFDLTRINWLTENDNDLLDVFVERGDPNTFHWMLSLTMKHDDNKSTESGVDPDFFFLVKACNTIVGTSSTFALREFMNFCYSQQGPTKYRRKRDLLMADMLNADRMEIQVPDYWGSGTVSQGGGGILGDILSSILNLSLSFHYEERDAQLLIAKIQDTYALARWFLGQPDVAKLLSCKETRMKCFKNIMSGDSIKYRACDSPHELFRIFSLMASYGFDLRAVDVDGSDLICILLDWDGRRCRSDRKLPPAAMEYVSSCDHYKDSSGSTVSTMPHLIRWLALEVKISMQHLNYFPSFQVLMNSFLYLLFTSWHVIFASFICGLVLHEPSPPPPESLGIDVK